MKKTTAKDSKNVIGGMVRSLRLSQRPAVTQDDLAGRLAARGITLDRTAIARIERGDRYVLDYEAAAIAAAFRVSLDHLFGRQ